MMDTEDKRARAVAFLQRMGAGTIDRTLVTDDLTWWVQGRDTYTLDEFEKIYAAFAAAKEGPGEQRIIGTTAEGDRVALETEGRSTYKGGHVYANSYHFLLTFRGDLICSVKEYYNSAYARDFMAKLQGGAD